MTQQNTQEKPRVTITLEFPSDLIIPSFYANMQILGGNIVSVQFDTPKNTSPLDEMPKEPE